MPLGVLQLHHHIRNIRLRNTAAADRHHVFKRGEYNQMFSNCNSNPIAKKCGIVSEYMGMELCARLFWYLFFFFLRRRDCRTRVPGNWVGYARRWQVVRRIFRVHCAWPSLRCSKANNWRYRLPYWRWPTPIFYRVSIHLKNKVGQKQRFHRCHNCIFAFLHCS